MKEIRPKGFWYDSEPTPVARTIGELADIITILPRELELTCVRMTKMSEILTDEDKQAILKEWDSNILFDLIEDVEAAVLEKLKQHDELQAEVTALRLELAESRANDRTAMGYLAQVRAIIGGDDFPDMVSRVEGIGGFKPWPATHLKTRNEYRVIGEAIDATNATEGRTMVIYRGNGQTFVREASEFMVKFASMQKGGVDAIRASSNEQASHYNFEIRSHD